MRHHLTLILEGSTGDDAGHALCTWHAPQPHFHQHVAGIENDFSETLGFFRLPNHEGLRRLEIAMVLVNDAAAGRVRGALVLPFSLLCRCG